MATVVRQTVVDHRESQYSMVVLCDGTCFATMMTAHEDEVALGISTPSPQKQSGSPKRSLYIEAT